MSIHGLASPQRNVRVTGSTLHMTLSATFVMVLIPHKMTSVELKQHELLMKHCPLQPLKRNASCRGGVSCVHASNGRATKLTVASSTVKSYHVCSKCNRGPFCSSMCMYAHFAKEHESQMPADLRGTKWTRGSNRILAPIRHLESIATTGFEAAAQVVDGVQVARRVIYSLEELNDAWVAVEKKPKVDRVLLAGVGNAELKTSILEQAGLAACKSYDLILVLNETVGAEPANRVAYDQSNIVSPQKREAFLGTMYTIESNTVVLNGWPVKRKEEIKFEHIHAVVVFDSVNDEDLNDVTELWNNKLASVGGSRRVLSKRGSAKMKCYGTRACGVSVCVLASPPTKYVSNQ